MLIVEMDVSDVESDIVDVDVDVECGITGMMNHCDRGPGPGGGYSFTR